VVGSLRAGVSRAELGEVTVVITDPVKKKQKRRGLDLEFQGLEEKKKKKKKKSYILW